MIQEMMTRFAMTRAIQHLIAAARTARWPHHRPHIIRNLKESFGE